MLSASFSRTNKRDKRPDTQSKNPVRGVRESPISWKKPSKIGDISRVKTVTMRTMLLKKIRRKTSLRISVYRVQCGLEIKFKDCDAYATV